MPIKKTALITKGEQSRCRILEAARKLFYQKGFFATSINDVAAEAGVLKGNLCYYYPSKSELLEGATSARIQEIRIQLEDWSRHGDNLYQSLERFLRMFEDSACDIAHYGCDIGTLTEELGKGEGRWQDQPRQILELLHNWLVQRFARILPSDEAEDHAEHLLAMVQGAAVLTHAYRSPDVLVRRGKMIRIWLKEVCEQK